MDNELYDSIIWTIRDFKGLSRDCSNLLVEKYPDIPKPTLQSILSLEYQRLMKCNYNKDSDTVNRYYELYNRCCKSGENPGFLIGLAIENNISPCLFAKLVLQKKYEYLMDVDDEGNTQEIDVNKLLRITSLIDDKILAYEIFLCDLYDDQYSPWHEAEKISLGQQYEIFISRQLTTLGLAFRDEEWLRKMGYDKTPDFKLDVPVCIDGFVIHWIESKALFGDAETHSEYLRNQYSSYWNRFGPGLVIYWCGFVKSIAYETTQEHIMIRDTIPDNIKKISYGATV